MVKLIEKLKELLVSKKLTDISEIDRGCKLEFGDIALFIEVSFDGELLLKPKRINYEDIF